MADYIDREELLARMEERLNSLRESYGEYDAYTNGFDEGCVAVDDAPPVDAVEVVRCKDCVCWQDDPWSDSGEKVCKCWCDWLPTNADDFCSFGERKDNG